jgi:hypothetical protein
LLADALNANLHALGIAEDLMVGESQAKSAQPVELSQPRLVH